LDLNIFRVGLTDEQQTLFRFQKMKPLSNKIKIEQTQFFIKTFNRKHFDILIKDCSSSIFIYPTITIQYLTIRERYSTKMNRPQTIYSPPIPITDVLDDNNTLIPYSPSFIHDINEDVDIRIQTDMEQILDAAISNSNEEHEQNKIFLELRSLIMTYMNEHETIKKTNINDLFETLHDNYSLPLIFSQLLHLSSNDLTKREKEELSRRRFYWLVYILRPPLFEKINKKFF